MCAQPRGLPLNQLYRRTGAVGVAATFLLWASVSCSGNSGDLVVSGRIEVDDVHIGSKIGGRVSEVCCEEGDPVAGGMPIVLLERQELEAQLTEAQAAAAQAQAQLDLLLAGTRQEDLDQAAAMVATRQADLDLRVQGYRAEDIRQGESRLAAVQNSLALAKKEYDRAQELLKAGVLQQQDVDAKHTVFLNAQTAVDGAKEELARLRAGFRPEEIAAARAQLEQAQAELARLQHGARPEELAAARATLNARQANIDRLKVQLDETRVMAPSDAVIETLDLEPGDLVRAGETVAVLQLPGQPWVRCYVPENAVGRIAPGVKVTVTCDAYPGKAFAGVVRRVNTEAEFTPRNVQTPETRAELVFETKIDLTGSTEGLRAGMYADVHFPKNG